MSRAWIAFITSLVASAGYLPFMGDWLDFTHFFIFGAYFPLLLLPLVFSEPGWFKGYVLFAAVVTTGVMGVVIYEEHFATFAETDGPGYPIGLLLFVLAALTAWFGTGLALAVRSIRRCIRSATFK